MTAVELRDVLGRDVSRETTDRLQHLVELVRKWNPRINLVAASTLDDLWQRHILDSAQIFPLAPASATKWADLGSGAGFPGIVLAILASATQQGTTHTLVESDQRKAVFLRTVVRELDLPADVITDRAERMPPLAAEVLTARALAPLDDLLGLAHRHLCADGIAIFPKGRRADAELGVARRNWRFSLSTRPSMTDVEATLLRIERIERV